MTHMRAIHSTSNAGSAKDAARTFKAHLDLAPRSVSRVLRIARRARSLAEAHPQASAVYGVILLAAHDRITQITIADSDLPGKPLAYRGHARDIEIHAIGARVGEV